MININNNLIKPYFNIHSSMQWQNRTNLQQQLGQHHQGYIEGKHSRHYGSH